MQKSKFTIRVSNMVEFARQLQRHDLENTIIGVDAQQRIIIMVEYNVEQLATIMELNLLND